MRGERIAWTLLALCGAGCSVIYDGDVFGRADATPPIDPGMLSLDAVEPSQVYEGQGASDESRPVPILIRGQNISPAARIVVTGPGISLDAPVDAGSSGTMAAFSLRVPVDDARSTNDIPAVITVTVVQGAVEDSIDLELIGLDELDASAGVLDVADLAPRYSRIVLDDDVQLIGESPARFVAMDGITVSSQVRANGRDDGQRAAGGALGGAIATTGGGAGGGGGGGSESGGGGGGNQVAGAPGQGNSPGAAGPGSQATLLSPLEQAAGAGGGGGGVGATAGAGGAGGGGIELRAGGEITVTAAAELSANGKAGANAGALCSGGGAGGGGSGGAFLLRSETMVTLDGTVSVAGGDGGAGGTGGLGCDGGAGATGQVRIDTPELGGAVSGSRRGPSWLPSSVLPIVLASELDATLVGGIGETYVVELNDNEVTTVTPADSNEVVSISLTPGLNTLCAQVVSNANPGQPESFNCVSIIYLAR